MVNMNHIVGTHDIVFMTLDTLRFDVAADALAQGQTPHFARWIGDAGWEQRFTSGSFTYAAHHAFFAGFLPTPARPGRHERLFASRFGGSETTGANTFVYPESSLPLALSRLGYRTICIGGVGFFNQQTELGSVFPNMFQTAEWSPEFGVTSVDSPALQFTRAAELLEESKQPTFLFINVSAIHQPNRHYVKGLEIDTLDSHRAALIAVDEALPILQNALSKRKHVFCIVCADHGTAYGEDGFSGHRIALPCVMNVPYAEFVHGD